MKHRRSKEETMYRILKRGVEIEVGTQSDFERGMGKDAHHSASIRAVFETLVKSGHIKMKLKKESDSIYQITHDGRDMMNKMKDLEKIIWTREQQESTVTT